MNNSATNTNESSIPINYVSLLYTTFRLAPFILVSFFSMSSIFNQDLKGLVYLAGLLFACFIAFMAGPMVGTSPEGKLPCSVLTLSGSKPISAIPLSIIVFTYTFAYLLYVIVKYQLAIQNIPTLVFFPVLILLDIFWNNTHQCSTPGNIIMGIAIGGMMGVIWGASIDYLKLTNMQYMLGISNKETCSVSKQKFRCKINSK
jgi:hypothetical protein